MTRPDAPIDPIVPELLRARLEAIGQEAGAAVVQTALSPIITETKDYSVTILDADGSIICASGLIDLHYGGAMHAVRSTIALHGETIADGDVFLANDPHSGGGLHPQDIVIQRPVFVGGERVAWVALAAHMMDMGGMVPGSSAVKATECYQEALRLPPVRLIRRHEECIDIWNIFRINVRSSDMVEMDMRSLVIGSAVAGDKLVDLVGEMGLDTFRSASAALLAGVERVLRDRIRRLEDGVYNSTAWIEWGDQVMRMPCSLEVRGDRLIFDLTELPPQVPFFINSKEYIIRAQIAPRVRQLLAPGLPFNQPVLDVVEIISTPGTLVNSVMPAPIAAAHMDAAIAIFMATGLCLQLAMHASPDSIGSEIITAPALSAYCTGRWTYLDDAGRPRPYTLIDGAFSGSPAADSRDGIDIKGSQMPGGNQLEFADVEILEAAYPLLFVERRASTGAHGYGRQRSGAGCRESFRAHNTQSLVGNITGTGAYFPSGGGAGGYPGARIEIAVHRADGRTEAVDIHQVGLALAPGDVFELTCATGGGYGDPLDREPAALAADVAQGRVSAEIARDIYGVAFAPDGGVDLAATQARRDAMRQDRLRRARPAINPVRTAEVDESEPTWPLYPGVVQRGALAVAEQSGAVLAVAPDNWLAGCPVVDTPLENGAENTIIHEYLDPASGRVLHVEVVRPNDGPSIEVRPKRWAQAGREHSKEGLAA